MTSLLRKPLLAVSCALALLAGPVSNAAADIVAGTLSFNDITTTSGGTLMQDGYGGFDWGNQWFSMRSTSVTNPVFLATSTSGGTLISRSDRSDFYFDGADFWSRRGLDAVGDFFFVLYLNGVAVYDGNALGRDGRMRFDADPTFLTPGYTGLIDAMAFGFDNDDYDHFAMDNFRFRANVAAPASTVSEPGSYALMLAGLGLLGWKRQRRTTPG